MFAPFLVWQTTPIYGICGSATIKTTLGKRTTQLMVRVRMFHTDNWVLLAAATRWHWFPCPNCTNSISFCLKLACSREVFSSQFSVAQIVSSLPKPTPNKEPSIVNDSPAHGKSRNVPRLVHLQIGPVSILVIIIKKYPRRNSYKKTYGVQWIHEPPAKFWNFYHKIQ